MLPCVSTTLRSKIVLPVATFEESAIDRYVKKYIVHLENENVIKTYYIEVRKDRLFETMLQISLHCVHILSERQEKARDSFIAENCYDNIVHRSKYLAITETCVHRKF